MYVCTYIGISIVRLTEIKWARCLKQNLFILSFHILREYLMSTSGLKLVNYDISNEYLYRNYTFVKGVFLWFVLKLLNSHKIKPFSRIAFNYEMCSKEKMNFDFSRAVYILLPIFCFCYNRTHIYVCLSCACIGANFD